MTHSTEHARAVSAHGRGRLIVIDGIDGSGKSAATACLVSALKSLGHTVLAGHEPTNGKHGRILRERMRTHRFPVDEEVQLLLEDRREHVSTVIEPALAAGRIVVLDRYYPSMVAYQGAAGVSTKYLLEANSFAPRPDLLLILDLPVDVALERIRVRGDVPNAFERADTLEQCRQTFLSFADAQVIDATRSRDDVANQVIGHAGRLLACAESTGSRPAPCDTEPVPWTTVHRISSF